MGTWYTEVYLQSDHWKAKVTSKRNEVRKKNSGVLHCERCYTEDGPFDTHHLPEAYDYLYREPLCLLKLLCVDCHRYVHQRGPDPLEQGTWQDIAPGATQA